jgi:RimJ/RimL family protein N-acetyltransferase
MKKNGSPFISEEITFRYADKDDEFLLLSWRNNPMVLKYSRTKDSIDQKIHARWINERLAEFEKQPIFIFYLKQKAIGMVRLDCINDTLKIFEISIIVDESFQNRGFATSMISQILRFAKTNLSTLEMRAVIHNGNIKSIRLFTNLNFIRIPNPMKEFGEFRIYL